MGLHLPVDPVATEGQANVGAVKLRIIGPAVVVAKHHHVTTGMIRNAGIERGRRRKWYLLRREHRVLEVSEHGEGG